MRPTSPTSVSPSDAHPSRLGVCGGREVGDVLLWLSRSSGSSCLFRVLGDGSNSHFSCPSSYFRSAPRTRNATLDAVAQTAAAKRAFVCECLGLPFWTRDQRADSLPSHRPYHYSAAALVILVKGRRVRTTPCAWATSDVAARVVRASTAQDTLPSAAASPPSACTPPATFPAIFRTTLLAFLVSYRTFSFGFRSRRVSTRRESSRRAKRLPPSLDSY